MCGYAESENNDIPPNPADNGLQGFSQNGVTGSNALSVG
jgi:hypothetical protein